MWSVDKKTPLFDKFINLGHKIATIIIIVVGPHKLGPKFKLQVGFCVVCHFDTIENYMQTFDCLEYNKMPLKFFHFILFY